MPRLTSIRLYARKARNGKENGNYKHGGWSEFMTENEKRKCEQDKERYLKAYPYLNEPVALDMLAEALKIKNVRIPKLEEFIDNPNVEFEKKIGAMKLLESLQRTLALFFTRLGITYQSKPRRQEPKRAKPPLVQITEDK